MRTKITLKTSLLAAVSVLAIAPQAMAQNSNQDDDGVSLEEIVVTASRRDQSLQDVPAAVTAVAPDTFKLKGLLEVKDVLNYTSGISFEEGGSPGAGTIAARGVPQSSATPVFGVYLDDTPLTSNTNFANGSNYYLDAMLMDIERIEVIKGPQGTLYGATSVGGMMRYISRDPALEDPRFSAGADASTTKGGGVGTVVNGRVSAPIVNNKLGVTLSGYQRDVAGFVDQVDPATGDIIAKDVDGGEVIGYAADLLFQPAEPIKLRAKYLKQKNDAQQTSSVNLDPESDNTTHGGFTTITVPGPKSFDVEVLSGTLEVDLSAATLTATASETEYDAAIIQDVTGLYGPFADLLQGNAPGTTTKVDVVAGSGSKKSVQEVRLTSAESDTLEWIAGYYRTNEDTYQVQDLQVTPAFDFAYANFPSNYSENAFFGDITYYFSDKFDITGGMRLSKNKIVLDLQTDGALLGKSLLEGEVIKDTVKTYLLAPRYRLDDNMSLYARIASGYRPAQPNIPVIDPATGTDIAPPVVFSDKAWSYEFGVKGSNEENTLNYDVALWTIDWANFQSPVSITGVNTGGNAEDGLSAHGFEASVTARPSEPFTLTANIGYTKSTLNSDEPTIGGNKGDDYPNLPNWKASLLWNYNLTLNDDWSGNVGGGLRYTGTSVGAFEAAVRQASVELDSRMLADLNFGATNGTLTLNVYATNLFNADKLAGRSDEKIAPGVVNSTGFFVRPRTVGANIRMDF